MVTENKALEGLRVLDMTQFMAGPYCGMMLADMGAEVIKIENPKIGDFTRTVQPKVNDVSMYFNNVNRNKKSVSVDLKSAEGKEIFAKLLKTADVFLENNRPGVMDRLGFGYEDAKKINEKIIYASVSGFGQYGPYKDRPGYDIIAQAMGGAMSVTGWPGNPPTRAGVVLGDVLGGMNAAIGILGALRHRDKTGKGQQIDVALVDSIVSSLETISMLYIYEGEVPTRSGNRYLAAYPYDSFSAKDGYYVLASGTELHFIALAKGMGMPELAEDERFNQMEKRKANHVELKEIINQWGSDKTVEECEQIINKAGVPVAPIYDLKQVYEDKHISEAREMFVEVDHPIAGRITVTGNPIKMSETPPRVRKCAPSLGENNDELYTEIGLDMQTINEYRAKKII